MRPGPGPCSLLRPLCSPDGYLYEREAILEYILHQKKEIARQLKAYEKQRAPRREEQKELQRAAAQDQVRGFLEKEAAIVSRPLNPFTPKTAPGTGPDDAQAGPSAAGPAGKDKDKDKDKMLPSFWIPSLTPEAKATKLEKPSRTVTCPMSGKPLRMSDLTPVRFTPLDSSVDRVGLITRSERYVCAVTRDSLSNATPCAVLRPSGAVVTLECVEKLIRKDMVDPVNGEKLTDRDIIVLQRVSRAPSTCLPVWPLPEAPPPRQATPSPRPRLPIRPLPSPRPRLLVGPSQDPASSSGHSPPQGPASRRPHPSPPLYPGPRPYPRRPAPYLRPRPPFLARLAWTTPPAPPPAFTLPSLPQGGTGFAGSGVKLQAEKSRPVMQA
ncbi:hypothetical protein QTO34_010129 [Cnephaeus nilssonii]|uniref:Nitric oxide synthase-interacting protein n=1 Tax=Cnephaeus nilssonii TaxID=3371016 RepID=A0AA40HFR7_CNENI|nr:hypothetical protein QTO34_010129 [Eptesicus nilssonii]